tara:strand:- start:1631 stop:2317 length:687 start_codon:yes stop_codon:yes gene_type:complete
MSNQAYTNVDGVSVEVESNLNKNNASITVTRALVELKTLDKRIQQLIKDSIFVSFQGQLRKPDARAKNAQSSYDRIRDLMNRRVKLKSAIVTSNASTRIHVCGMDLTVAEAIEMKSSIKNYKGLLNKMRQQYGDAVSTVEVENQRARSTLENSLSRGNGRGNNSGDDRLNEINVSDYSLQYMRVHGVELFDPIKLEDKIEGLEKFITEFESEVDFVLSEKNATTYIAI